ncbi:MYND-type domain-containing protein [Mycena venus]|uniref:MYND-type domain-containing protein n=1 Tax=Mycena venus TaxID=2733690 RepID=A0A8H6X4V9_9AGAR|nr:MYND-type domain-containing protein [Mycena venus]
MHRAVEKTNIQRLSASQRRVAMLACKSGRSLHDLRRVEQLVGGASEAQKMLYLPVFYICLDPAEIPTPEELDSFPPDVTTRIDCASLSLRLLFDLIVDIDFAQQVGPTLWVHVWPWVYFLHQHREYISDKTLVFHENIIYGLFFIFVTQMYSPDSTHTLVSSTPGFRAILAKSWGFLDGIKTTGAFQSCFWSFANLLESLDFIDPVHFTEMIDGAGGALDDLARLVMEYLDHLIERQNSWEYGSLGAYLRCLMIFIDEGGAANAPDLPSSQPSLHEQFIETLHRHGFVSAFVTAAKFLLDPNKKIGCFA